MKTFKVTCDPGHGWIHVPLKTLHELNIEKEISSYSYVSNTTAFLEEECDADVFIKAYEEKFDDKPKFNVHHTNRYSRIRSMECYNFKK